LPCSGQPYVNEPRLTEKSTRTDGAGSAEQASQVSADPAKERPSAARYNLGGHCQSKFVYFAKTSEPDFAAINFPAFFRVDLSGSMAAPSI
jgi:hypothetical protein